MVFKNQNIFMIRFQIIFPVFERVIEQRLRSYLEDIGFINKYKSGFRHNKSTDDHLFRLSQSVMEVSTEENM